MNNVLMLMIKKCKVTKKGKNRERVVDKFIYNIMLLVSLITIAESGSYCEKWSQITDIILYI